jgi:recombination protein RecT
MNAAVLGLPIDNNLSYAAIIPFGKKAQFQIMIKGYIQLAIDTGLYESIHVTEVYEDELDYHDPIRDKTHFTDKDEWNQRMSGQKNKIIGYFAYIKYKNGFYKEKFMWKKDVEAHGKTYSKSFKYGVWKDNFDAMGKKTVLKLLLRNYGKLGKDSQKLNMALEADQGFTNNLNINEISYDDNPKNDTEYEVSIEDEFSEENPIKA